MVEAQVGHIENKSLALPPALRPFVMRSFLPRFHHTQTVKVNHDFHSTLAYVKWFTHLALHRVSFSVMNLQIDVSIQKIEIPTISTGAQPLSAEYSWFAQIIKTTPKMVARSACGFIGTPSLALRAWRRLAFLRRWLLLAWQINPNAGCAR